MDDDSFLDLSGESDYDDDLDKELTKEDLLLVKQKETVEWAQQPGRPFAGIPEIHIAIYYGFDELTNRYLNELSEDDLWEAHPKLGTPLSHAIYKENFKLAETLLSRGNKDDMDKANKDGNAPIHFAVQRGNKSLVRSLIDKGANVNLQTGKGRTPLFCAMVPEVQKDPDTVTLLIERGADVNIKDKRGMAPIYAATLSYLSDNLRDATIVKLLLDVEHIDVNAPYDGKTALHLIMASEPLYLDSADLAIDMIKVGADSTVRAPDGETLLHRMAARLGAEYPADPAADVNRAIRLFALPNVEINIQDKFGFTPIARLLFTAPMSDNFRVVAHSLLKAGADINIAYDKGHILDWMMDNKRNDKINFLLESNVDVNAVRLDGDSPLHRAVIMKNENLVRDLIFRGADVNAVSLNGDSPLQRAVITENENIVRDLIFRGADVNAVSLNGDSILVSTLRRDSFDIDMSIILLDSGADMGFVSQDGMTALHLLPYSSDHMTVGRWKRILDHASKEDVNRVAVVDHNSTHFAANGDTFVHSMAQYIHNVEIWRFFEDKIVIDVQGRRLQTALHRATRNGNSVGAMRGPSPRARNELVSFLLDRGFSVTIPDEDGQTPIHNAAERLNVSLFKKFLSKADSFDLNQRDKMGRTLLMLALSRLTEGIRLVKDLLKRNVDLNIMDGDGKTALARLVGTVRPRRDVMNTIGELISMLLNAGADFRLGFPIDHETVLLWLTKNRMTTAAISLLGKNGVDPNGRNSNGVSILHMAIVNRLDDLVLALLKKGATIAKGSPENHSLLHEAVSRSLSKVVIEALVEKGADVYFLNLHGESLLRPAVSANRLDLLEFFMAKGVTISKGDVEHDSILYASVRIHRNVPITKLLLENGVDPNIPKVISKVLHVGNSNEIDAKDELYVLNLAANYTNNVDMVKLLLEKGARPNTPNIISEVDPDGTLREDKLYAINIAVKNERVDMVIELLAYGAEKRHLDTSLLNVDSEQMRTIKQTLDRWGMVNSLQNMALGVLANTGQFNNIIPGLRKYTLSDMMLENERKRIEREENARLHNSSSSSSQTTSSSSFSQTATSSSSPQTTSSSSFSQPATSSSSSQTTSSSPSSQPATRSSFSQPATSSSSSQTTSSSSFSQPATSSSSSQTTSSSSFSQPATSSSFSQTAPSSPPNRRGKKRGSESEEKSSEKRKKAQIQMQIKAAFKACRSGNVALVSSILRQEPILINSKLRDGTTLHDYFLRHNKTPLKLELNKV